MGRHPIHSGSHIYVCWNICWHDGWCDWWCSHIHSLIRLEKDNRVREASKKGFEG